MYVCSQTVSTCREGVFAERPMTAEDKQKVKDYASSMASKGLRVLALASGPRMDHMCFAGYVYYLSSKYSVCSVNIYPLM